MDDEKIDNSVRYVRFPTGLVFRYREAIYKILSGTNIYFNIKLSSRPKFSILYSPLSISFME